jgi:hypothetical protein
MSLIPNPHAAQLFQELALPDVVVVDQSDAWSERDQADLTSFSLKHAEELYPEEESLV